MPDDFLAKIKELCRVISAVEWSGILLYETVGSIQDISTMEIHLKDVILMDKGSKAYTEYDFTEKKRDQSGYTDRHIEYTEEVEDAIYWQIGHIHSHNTMKVFFSGTDMDELKENADSHNFYLSLIVNNALDFEAKIAFMAKVKMTVEAEFMALDENGVSYLHSTKPMTVTSSKMVIYDTYIESSKAVRTEETFFQRNLRDVLYSADAPKSTYSRQPSPTIPQKKTPGWVKPAATPMPNPVNRFPNIISAEDAYQDAYQDDWEDMWSDSFGVDREIDEEIDIHRNSLLPTRGPSTETFITALLDPNSNIPGHYSPKVFFETHSNYPHTQSKNYISLLLKGYSTTYFKVYSTYDRIVETDAEIGFITRSEEAVNFLEEYEADYPHLTPIIVGIKLIVDTYLQELE